VQPINAQTKFSRNSSAHARLQLYYPDYSHTFSKSNQIPQISTKCACARQQKVEFLKNYYPCLYKHLRSSRTRKYPNFRPKRASQPKYEGYIDIPARLLSRCNYACQKNRDAPRPHLAAQIHQKRTRAHKTTPFMQNKANFRRPLMSVTLAITSTYEQKPPLEAPKNKANLKRNRQPASPRPASISGFCPVILLSYVPYRQDRTK